MRTYVFRRYATEQFVFSNNRLHYSKFIFLYLFIYREGKKKRIFCTIFEERFHLEISNFFKLQFYRATKLFATSRTYTYTYMSVFIYILSQVEDNIFIYLAFTIIFPPSLKLIDCIINAYHKIL